MPNSRRALLGARVLAVERWGKQLWFELDRAPHPLFHFGMTGAFASPTARLLALKAGPAVTEAEWPPRFSKIHLHLDDDGELAMVDARRFGRIGLSDDPRGEPPVARLGFDPLHAMPDRDTFRALLGRRAGNLKGLLLNQRFVAGVGNWIADEVLYQARIDPRRAAGSRWVTSRVRR